MQGATDVKKVAENNKILEPYVIVIGSPDSFSQAFLVIDGCVIDEITVVQTVPLILVASYYVFNICYPKGLNSFYSVLEAILLDSPLDNASPTVKHMYASILCNYSCRSYPE